MPTLATTEGTRLPLVGISPTNVAAGSHFRWDVSGSTATLGVDFVISTEVRPTETVPNDFQYLVVDILKDDLSDPGEYINIRIEVVTPQPFPPGTPDLVQTYDFRLNIAEGIFTSASDVVDFDTLDPKAGLTPSFDALEGDDVVTLGANYAAWGFRPAGGTPGQANLGVTPFLGGAGSDTLTGGPGGDALFGGGIDFGSDSAANHLRGMGGNDWLHGASGGDRLEGGAGSDTLFGFRGPDTLVGGAGQDFLFGGDGDDQLNGLNEAEVNVLDRLSGDAGKDTFIVDAGDEVVAFGAEDDAIIFSTSGAVDRAIIEYNGQRTTVKAYTDATHYESFTISTGISSYALDAKAFEGIGIRGIILTRDESAVSTTSRFAIDDAAAKQKIATETARLKAVIDATSDYTVSQGVNLGLDALKTGAAQEWAFKTISLATAKKLVGFLSGVGVAVDTAKLAAGLYDIYQNNALGEYDGKPLQAAEDLALLFADRLTGEAGVLVYQYGKYYVATLVDQAVETSISGLNAFVSMLQGAAPDPAATGTPSISTKRFGTTSYNTGNGDDLFFGAALRTTVQAPTRATLSAPGEGDGDDVVDAGGGVDMLAYTLASAAVAVNLSAQSAVGLSIGNDTVRNFENASGSAFSDTLTGDSQPNEIAGEAGNDSLEGGQGGDTINGGAGADTIVETDNSSNYLRGDEGNDSIAGGAGFNDINGNMGNDTVNAGTGNSWAVGGKDNDSLAGGSGLNLVYGNLGADTCDGGAGSDTIRGGQDNDVVRGGDGVDFVSGDKGDDTMSGGTGADVFHTFGDAALDRVIDFNQAEGDRVQVDPGTQYTVGQVGSDTVITMTGGGQMILVGVAMTSLADNWIFGG